MLVYPGVYQHAGLKEGKLQALITKSVGVESISMHSLKLFILFLLPQYRHFSVDGVRLTSALYPSMATCFLRMGIAGCFTITTRVVRQFVSPTLRVTLSYGVHHLSTCAVVTFWVFVDLGSRGYHQPYTGIPRLIPACRYTCSYQKWSRPILVILAYTGMLLYTRKYGSSLAICDGITANCCHLLYFLYTTSMYCTLYSTYILQYR